MRRSVLLFVLLLALPLVGAQAPGAVGGPAPPPTDTGYEGPPVIVPLYAHVFDLLQKAPMNTQPMPDMDLARGFGSPAVGSTGPFPGAFQETNEFYMFSSPGLVEYNITYEDGSPRTHPERGISYDVLFAQGQPLVGYWYMSVKAFDLPQQGMTDGPEAGIMPGFTVRMTMRAGDDIGADLDAGPIIAQGEATLDDPTTWVVNGEAIEFRIDMGEPQLDRIPGDEAFNVKVEWFNAQTPDGAQLTQRDWILHTGERYPNRVELHVVNPLALYSLRPTPIGEDLLAFRAELNSPFGNYDVDAETLEIVIDGPSRPQTLAPPRVVQKSFGHDHHYEPVLATWTWPYREQGAAPGEYTVTVRAANLQGTATVEKSAKFVIPEQGRASGFADDGALVAAEEEAPARETPMPVVVALVAVLGAALLLRRR